MIILLVFNNNVRRSLYNTRIQSVIFQVRHFAPPANWSIFQVLYFPLLLFGPLFSGAAFSGDPILCVDAHVNANAMLSST